MNKNLKKLLDIKGIYDNGGKTADRYSIVFNSWSDCAETLRDCLGLSDVSPDGFAAYSEHCAAMPGLHLGRRVDFDKLPVPVQRHIIRRRGFRTLAEKQQ